MVKSLILMVLGAITVFVGYYFLDASGHTFLGILDALLIALGGGFIAWGIAVLLDTISPTSTKK